MDTDNVIKFKIKEEVISHEELPQFQHVEIKMEPCLDVQSETINESLTQSIQSEKFIEDVQFKTVPCDEGFIKDEVDVISAEDEPIAFLNNEVTSSDAKNVCELTPDVEEIKEEVAETIQIEEFDVNNVDLKSEPLIKLEPGDKPFQCIFCKGRFIDKPGLMQHFWEKGGCLRHECPKCKHKFTRKSTFSNHIKRCTKCKICQKPFANKDRLSQHMRIHTKIVCKKSFVCEICQNAYTSENGLRLHMEMHKSDVEYECDTCKIRFNSIKLINIHIKSHSAIKSIICSDKKPFKCKICKNTFKNRVALNRHVKIHDDNRPLFYCNLCPKKYFTKTSLRRHFKWHSVKKPYFCKICQTSFAGSSHSRVHLTKSFF